MGNADAIQFTLTVVRREHLRELPPEIRLVGRLDRADPETAVAVLAIEVSPKPELLEEAIRGIETEFDAWSLPVGWEPQPWGWAIASGREDEPIILVEFAHNEPPSWRPPRALREAGWTIGPWADRPPEATHGLEACAVVAVRATDYAVHVFVNDMARCSHEHLADDINRITKDLKTTGPDAGWTPVVLENGTKPAAWITAILTRSAASRAPGAGPQGPPSPQQPPE